MTSDSYLPCYLALAIPPKDILSDYRTSIDGIDLPGAEALMVLKLGAFAERGKSIKGWKDSVDIVALLSKGGFGIKEFGRITDRYGHKEYPRMLIRILSGFDKALLPYLNLNEKSFARLKNLRSKEIKGNFRY